MHQVKIHNHPPPTLFNISWTFGGKQKLNLLIKSNISRDVGFLSFEPLYSHKVIKRNRQGQLLVCMSVF